MIKAAPLLGEEQGWAAIRGGANRFTSFFLLNAFDLRWTDQGAIGAVPAEQAVFLRVFGRTFLIATIVTLATLALGFPLAYVITNLRPATASLVLVLVLLPFWTSHPRAHRGMDGDIAKISDCSTISCFGSA